MICFGRPVCLTLLILFATMRSKYGLEEFGAWQKGAGGVMWS